MYPLIFKMNSYFVGVKSSCGSNLGRPRLLFQ